MGSFLLVRREIEAMSNFPLASSKIPPLLTRKACPIRDN
jgi:hypothetical protein